MAPNRATEAEVSHIPALKSCLVNLPPALVTVLSNANTLAQNVVAELVFRQTLPPSLEKDRPTSIQRSVFVGWTGMQSRRKLAPVIGQDGISRNRAAGAGREQEVAVVEMDPVFARLLGIADGEKVGIMLHIDPPQAHTINVEPLTPADWEMIEIHAQFLELNFLSQVRALPNPAFSSHESPGLQPHPITLHLSPTSTANVTVVSVAPSPPSNSPFVKISSDAEIIVAPKERPREKPSNRENRSVTSKRSTGGRSGASTVRKKNGREQSNKGSIFLRGVARDVKCDWFDDEDEEMLDDGLRVWVDRDLLHTKSLKGVNWVSISIVKPTGIQEKIDPQKDAVESEKPTTKLVARIGVWEDAPDDQHAALSTMLCNCLSSSGLVGGLVRIEPAPARLDPATVQSKSKDTTHRFGLKIYPFLSSPSSQTSGLKFGGESKQEREESVHRLRAVFAAFARKSGGNGLLNGPLTDGMLLPVVKEQGKDWNGGILRFEPATSSPEGSQAPVSWILPADKSLPMEFLPEIARPSNAMKSWSPGESLLPNPPSLVGIDSMVNQLISHLAHSSSVLLSGRLGCGKSIVAQLIAHRLRSEYLFHTVYFPCRSRITGETRVSVVKDTLGRLFAAASWGARLGGRAVVILDDLDSLCPAETELGEGGDNVRSRHISESLCAVVRQHCTQESGVVLLATSQSKEALNNVIIGSHVVREIMNLSSPNKDMRRRVLEALFEEHKPEVNGVSDKSPLPSIKSSPATKSVESRPSTSDGPPGFDISPNVDFLDLAGQTDGYMPGDLVLLASRARSECLIRSVVDAMSSSPSSRLTLSTADFDAALKGFTPASLRNVTLQTSTVRWSSIGGLESTRKVLLETLQYPTTYAPIFSRCPLRLRSGIMLYGYPGCGKTLLASAIASECGLNFISVKGPEILNKYIGASEKSVRDLFERAQAARPCVLFFDEFDSIAPKRGHDSTGVTDRVVNQLLTQMDGAEGLGEGVYVLAATSRPDLVDPALLRPGRLDKSIICDMPNLEDRTNILGAVAANLKIDENVKARWSEVAKKTEGFSGADLQALVYNAQLEAVHDVLGDGSAKDGIGNSKFGAQRNGSSKFKRTPDFEMFRLDDSADTDSRDHSSTFLAERAVIAAKLRDMQAAKRSQKAALKAQAQQQLRHRASQQDADSGDDMWDHSPPPLSRKAGGDDSRAVVGVEGDHKRDKEPTILWRHIQSSLSLTRSSISPEERRRLERIYREFVVGRSGDLPSGQGSTEIGGRTSLM